MDTILLNGLRFFSHVGVFEDEKANGQWFELDLECSFADPIPAVDSDNLADSVSYADIYDVVKSVVEPARFDLIEYLAGEVMRAVLDRFPIDRVRLTVKKPDAPVDGEFAYMGVRFERAGQQDRARRLACFVAIGGNLGDREATMISAVKAVSAHPGIHLKGVSSLYETAPFGVADDQPDYLNAVLWLDTTLDPFALLRFLQDVERRHGRVRLKRWGARTLDLDILSIEGVRISAPDLELPHPRMAERAFVQIPLAELTGQTVPPDASVRFYKSDWYCPLSVQTLE